MEDDTLLQKLLTVMRAIQSSPILFCAFAFDNSDAFLFHYFGQIQAGNDFISGNHFGAMIHIFLLLFNGLILFQAEGIISFCSTVMH